MTTAGFACGHRLAMAAVHLLGILPPIKPTNQMVSRLFGFSLTGFDATSLIGQYFSSWYFGAIAAAMLLSKVPAITELQPFERGYGWLIAWR